METLSTGLLIFSLYFHYTFGVEVSGPPATTYVNLGDTAVLSCFVTNHTNGTVTWSKIIGGSPADYFQIGPGGVVTNGDGLALPASVYKVVVDPVGSTDYWANMTIVTVNTGDLSKYSCWTGTFGDEADVGELLLAELPSSVEISESSGGEVKVFEGVAHTLTCTAYNSKPQVSIQWTIDGTNVAEDSTNFTKNSDGTFTTTSYMTYTYTNATHHGKSVECVATNVAGNNSISVTLSVIRVPTTITNPDGTPIMTANPTMPTTTANPTIPTTTIIHSTSTTTAIPTTSTTTTIPTTSTTTANPTTPTTTAIPTTSTTTVNPTTPTTTNNPTTPTTTAIPTTSTTTANPTTPTTTTNPTTPPTTAIPTTSTTTAIPTTSTTTVNPTTPTTTTNPTTSTTTINPTTPPTTTNPTTPTTTAIPTTATTTSIPTTATTTAIPTTSTTTVNPTTPPTTAIPTTSTTTAIPTTPTTTAIPTTSTTTSITTTSTMTTYSTTSTTTATTSIPATSATTANLTTSTATANLTTPVTTDTPNISTTSTTPTASTTMAILTTPATTTTGRPINGASTATLYIIIGAALGGVLLITIFIILLTLYVFRRKTIKKSAKIESHEMARVPEGALLSAGGQNGQINKQAEKPSVLVKVQNTKINKNGNAKINKNGVKANGEAQNGKNQPNPVVEEALYAKINKKKKKPSNEFSNKADIAAATAIPPPQVPPHLGNDGLAQKNSDADQPKESSNPYEEISRENPDGQVSIENPQKKIDGEENCTPAEICVAEIRFAEIKENSNPYEKISMEHLDGQIPRENPDDQRPPTESPYELVGVPEEKRNNHPQGLVYADLDFPKPAATDSRRPQPKHGETAYATIDFTGEAQV